MKITRHPSIFKLIAGDEGLPERPATWQQRSTAKRERVQAMKKHPAYQKGFTTEAAAESAADEIGADLGFKVWVGEQFATLSF